MNFVGTALRMLFMYATVYGLIAGCWHLSQWEFSAVPNFSIGLAAYLGLYEIRSV